jgi:protein-ribulosamine 3-kinase
MNAFDIIPKILGESVKNVTRLSGGDINEVYSVETVTGSVVVKMNHADSFPDMLQKEAKGLGLLAAAGALKTPQVVSAGEIDGTQFLVLERITTATAGEQSWIRFGQQLASQHKQTDTHFGLDHNNYIGSLVQLNLSCETWAEFYITQRLQPMVEMAVNQGDINYVEAKIFDDFYQRIDAIFPVEKPALLHGDLWSGNYLIDANREPVLIDPAVYYGHREMDLAMMHLFGGFSPVLFESYNEVHPLQAGWRDRVPYCQVYPLLVHVNLFGRSYWERTKQALQGH